MRSNIKRPKKRYNEIRLTDKSIKKCPNSQCDKSLSVITEYFGQLKYTFVYCSECKTAYLNPGWIPAEYFRKNRSINISIVDERYKKKCLELTNGQNKVLLKEGTIISPLKIENVKNKKRRRKKKREIQDAHSFNEGQDIECRLTNPINPKTTSKRRITSDY